MITVNVVMISLLLAMSLAMGLFSITQMGYQNRLGGIRMFFYGIYTFVKGFIGWPILFPIGLMEGKYKMNVFHKIGNTKEDI